MEKKTRSTWWVRIHASKVKTDEDAGKLLNLQLKYEANFNTHTTRSMWFNFPSKLHAIGFVNNITGQIPYLKITMGNNFVRC